MPQLTFARAQALNATVSTARLLLEPQREAHADCLFSSLQAAPIYRWISALPPASLGALRAAWRRSESRFVAGGDVYSLNWAVKRVSDGRYVGRFDAEINREVATNVGYLFFPEFWGQGYATEAVRGVAAHVEALGICELRALATLGNDASARVLTKAGFSQTRIIPDNDLIRGEKFDDVEFVRQRSARNGGLVSGPLCPEVKVSPQ